jgi:putative transposase
MLGLEVGMGHAFVNSEYHCVFSTKERQPYLTPELRQRLFPCMTGIARNKNIHIEIIGGIENHVHILMAVPGSVALSKAVQVLKGTSSKWVHDTFPSLQFAWQEGYGAFSIGISQRSSTISYIKNQEHHHRNKTFEEEFRIFITKHGFKFDERVCFG